MFWNEKAEREKELGNLELTVNMKCFEIGIGEQ